MSHVLHDEDRIFGIAMRSSIQAFEPQRPSGWDRGLMNERSHAGLNPEGAIFFPFSW